MTAHVDVVYNSHGKLLELSANIQKAEKEQAFNLYILDLVRESQLRLERLTTEYSQLWLQEAQERLDAENMTWCTMCQAVIGKDTIEGLLFLITFTKKQSVDANVHHEKVAPSPALTGHLHRACKKCHTEALQKSSRDERTYRARGNGKDMVYAFPAEEEDGDYFALIFGDRKRVDPLVRDLHKCIPKEICQHLADILKLPPFLELSEGGSAQFAPLHE